VPSLKVALSLHRTIQSYNLRNEVLFCILSWSTEYSVWVRIICCEMFDFFCSVRKRSFLENKQICITLHRQQLLWMM
jgi:hypothetical protein